MRTDVKIGLVCLFLIVLMVVGYFAFVRDQTHEPAAQRPPTPPASPTGSMGDNAPGLALNNGSGGGLSFGPSVASAATLPAASEPAPVKLEPLVPANVHQADASSTPITFVPASTAPASGSPFMPEPATRNGPPVDLAHPGAAPADQTHADPFATSAQTTYTIASGDTYGKIARLKHVSVQALRDANPGVDEMKLQIGHKINLSAAASSDGALVAATTSSSGSAAATAPPAGGNYAGGTYTVKAGDTLTNISVRIYGSKKYVRKIARDNADKLPDPDTLPVGLTLKLPPA